MSRRVKQSWRLDVLEGAQRDVLLLEVELVTDERGALAWWSFSARLERAPGPRLLHERLPPHGALSIDHTFRNRIHLSGTLTVVVLDEGVRIWAALQHRYEREVPHFFQGVLAELPVVEPPPVPPPPPLPPELDDLPLDEGCDGPPIIEPAGRPCGVPTSEAVADLVGDGGDLFPYTYMRGWPEPSSAQLALRFVSYPYAPDAAPSGQWMRELAALRRQASPDAREAMGALTVRYLHGDFGQDAPFLDSLEALSGPITAYPRVFALLDARERRPGERLAEVWRALGMTAEETAAFLQTAAHQADVARLWQSYLALVVELGFDRRGRGRLAQALIVEHALGWLVARGPAAPEPTLLDALVEAVVVLPSAIFPLPPGPASPPLQSPPDPAEGGDGVIVPYAIGDLLMVKHALRGYALGELAYVESLRAGERREEQRRQRDRTVEASVETRADGDEQASGARTASSSLTSEVLGTVADTMTTTTYHDFGTSYGPPTTATLTGGWSVEEKPAGDPSKEDLTRFAREVLSKTLHRISHRVAEVRGRTSLRDSEETVISVVDNTAGARNRRAVYRWLDEVYGARVINYGNRLLFEMIVEAPAAHFLRAERAPAFGDHAPPLPPAALGIETYEDIREGSFAALVARYPGAELELPPPARRTVSTGLRSGEARAVELPEGYLAISAAVGYAPGAGSAPLTLQGVIGRQAFQLAVSAAGVERVALDAEDGAVQVAVQLSGQAAPPPAAATALAPSSLEAARAVAGGPTLALEIETAPSRRTREAWQLRTFQAIQRSYQAQRQAYERALAPDAVRPLAGGELRPRLSPRAIERKELKRGAIALLFARLAQRMGGAERPGSGQLASELELARPRYLRFFETGFEWREMTYSFLSARWPHGSPESGAPGGEGAAALTSATSAAAVAGRFGDDPRFLEFLEAAYARLLVPVTLAQAQALLFFLSSGALWDAPELAGGSHRHPGGRPAPRLPHVAVHEGDVALVYELLSAAHACSPPQPQLVRELPPIRVPTSIAVLTDGDVPLLPERPAVVGAGAAALEARASSSDALLAEAAAAPSAPLAPLAPFASALGDPS